MNNTMLETLQSSHTTLDGLKMLMITWNVNAKLDEAQNLKQLFFKEEEKCFGSTPEIIVFGLQEMVELSTTNVIGGSMVGNSQERVEQWRAMLLQVLREEDKSFEMVTSKNMVGLWITVFSLRQFRQHISKIQVACLGRGVGGVLGNKGAVYARFYIRDTSICLVCAHFAAHREHLHKRNEDFYAILTHKAFPEVLDAACTLELSNLSQHAGAAMVAESAKCARMQERIASMKRTLCANKIPCPPPMNTKQEMLANYTGPLDHDIILWMGDLNYRLIAGMENSRIYDIIDGRRSYALLNMDQLNIERERGNVFQGFHEGMITFDPTYKYVPGSTIGYNRERCPAWCDRVLWKLKNNYISPNEYVDITPEDLTPAVTPSVAPNTDLQDSDASVCANNTLSALMEECSTPASILQSTTIDNVVSAAAISTTTTTTTSPAAATTNGDIATFEHSVMKEEENKEEDDDDDDEIEESGKQNDSAMQQSSPLDTQSSPVSSTIIDTPDCSSTYGNAVDEPATATIPTSLPPLVQEAAAKDQSSSTASTTSELAPEQLPPSLAPSRLSYLHSKPDPKVTEIVELMVYNRGENIISDHKPVRALMGIKYKKVDWASHERQLLDQYALRCAGRPYQSTCFSSVHGRAPVSFSPKYIALLSTIDATSAPILDVRNNSSTNTVRFSVAGSSLPEWVAVSPKEGIIPPGGIVSLTFSQNNDAADKIYMDAMIEDSLHMDDELQAVWRRHIRNPDTRGNPQLSTVLQIDLFTHFASATSITSNAPVPSHVMKSTEQGGVLNGVDDVADGALDEGSDSSLHSNLLNSLNEQKRNIDIASECVMRMTPVIVPILYKIASS